MMRLLNALALGVLLLAGCQPPPATPVPVSGKVYYRGMPLPGGLIVFTPDTTRGESGPIAFCEIRADGSYDLKMDGAAGITPGWYRVTVAAVANAYSAFDASPTSLIPERYRDPTLSQLQVEVKANLITPHDFILMD